MNLFKNIFSVKNDELYKTFSILGIKIKFRNIALMLTEIKDFSIKSYNQYVYNDRNIKSSPTRDYLFTERFKNANFKDKYINLIRRLDEGETY